MNEIGCSFQVHFGFGGFVGLKIFKNSSLQALLNNVGLSLFTVSRTTNYDEGMRMFMLAFYTVIYSYVFNFE